MTIEQDILKELKDINKVVTQIQIKTAENTIHLEDHIRRTELLETSVDLLKKEIHKYKGFIVYGGWALGIAAAVKELLF